MVTELGTLNLQRDYYYDKVEGKYQTVLDEIIGVRAYDRVGDCLSAKMVSFSTEVSYAKSAAVECDGKVSRQTVKNCIQKLGAMEILCEWKEPKAVKELHVYADEDHVHMQKPGKEKGKIKNSSFCDSDRRNRAGRNTEKQDKRNSIFCR